MYCTGCGAKIPENAGFCADCGKNIDEAEVVQPEVERLRDPENLENLTVTLENDTVTREIIEKHWGSHYFNIVLISAEELPEKCLVWLATYLVGGLIGLFGGFFGVILGLAAAYLVDFVVTMIIWKRHSEIRFKTPDSLTSPTFI